MRPMTQLLSGMRFAALAVLATTLARPSAGQTLVRDINLEPLVPGIGLGPNNLIPLGGLALFRGNLAGTGSELYVSDGTTAGTFQLVDIDPGSPSGGASGLTDVDGTIFFIANTNALGVALWKTDGTSPGTENRAHLDHVRRQGRLRRGAVLLDQRSSCRSRFRHSSTARSRSRAGRSKSRACRRRWRTRCCRTR